MGVWVREREITLCIVQCSRSERDFVTLCGVQCRQVRERERESQRAFVTLCRVQSRSERERLRSNKNVHPRTRAHVDF